MTLPGTIFLYQHSLENLKQFFGRKSFCFKPKCVTAKLEDRMLCWSTPVFERATTSYFSVVQYTIYLEIPMNSVLLLAFCESLMVNLSPLHISEQREKATSRIKQLNKPKSKKFFRFFFSIFFFVL